MMASPFLASRAPTICGESVFWMVAVSPILAASAWAISMSKPTAWLLVSIDSWGGYVVSERNVMVPGRTRLVGGVMVGGVGLTIASPDVEGEALTTPGLGRAQAASVRARKALSAMRALNAAVISLLLARAGLLSWPKLATQFYDRRPRPARRLYAEPLVSDTRRPVAGPRRRGGGGPPWRPRQPGAAGENPPAARPRSGRPAGRRGSGGLRPDDRRGGVEERAHSTGGHPTASAQPLHEPRGRRR